MYDRIFEPHHDALHFPHYDADDDDGRWDAETMLEEMRWKRGKEGKKERNPDALHSLPYDADDDRWYEDIVFEEMEIQGVEFGEMWKKGITFEEVMRKRIERKERKQIKCS